MTPEAYIEEKHLQEDNEEQYLRHLKKEAERESPEAVNECPDHQTEGERRRQK